MYFESLRGDEPRPLQHSPPMPIAAVGRQSDYRFGSGPRQKEQTATSILTGGAANAGQPSAVSASSADLIPLSEPWPPCGSRPNLGSANASSFIRTPGAFLKRSQFLQALIDIAAALTLVFVALAVALSIPLAILVMFLVSR